MRIPIRHERPGRYIDVVSVGLTVVILAVLSAINFLANRYDKSWDSTANKQFSLADQTIKYVKGLKSDVKVTYFGNTETFTNARDLLDRGHAWAALIPLATCVVLVGVVPSLVYPVVFAVTLVALLVERPGPEGVAAHGATP